MGERVEPINTGPDLVGVTTERNNQTQQPPPPSVLTRQSSVWVRKQQAVCVRHAYKNYGSKKNPNHVLSDLNMTVSKGTM